VIYDINASAFNKGLGRLRGDRIWKTELMHERNDERQRNVNGEERERERETSGIVFGNVTKILEE